LFALAARKVVVGDSLTLRYWQQFAQRYLTVLCHAPGSAVSIEIEPPSAAEFREIIDPLEHHLRQVFGRPGLTLHGGTSVKRRREIVERFQAEDGPPFFILSLKAGGTGLNLTAASHVIHFDRWWNPAVENQATDRAFRIGQKRNVLVHKFITNGTVEQRIDELIAEKRELAEQLLTGDGGEVKLTELPDEQLLQLVRLDAAQAMM
jgi:non-specific serine/threonine protein kinase